MPGRMNDTILNVTRHLIKKQAFVPGADMSGGGGAPPGDPAAQGMPPEGDPSMAGGGGGAPPGQDPFAIIQQLQQQMMQMQQQMQQMGQGGGAAAGGGAGGAAGGLKPKIDVNVVLSQILKILARITDHLGIPVPATEMVTNQQDLMGLAQASQSGGAMPGMDPTAQAGGGAPPGGGGAIGGMPPMQGSGVPGQADPTKTGSYRPNGDSVDAHAYAGVSGGRLSALRQLINARSRVA